MCIWSCLMLNQIIGPPRSALFHLAASGAPGSLAIGPLWRVDAYKLWLHFPIKNLKKKWLNCEIFFFTAFNLQKQTCQF